MKHFMYFNLGLLSIIPCAWASFQLAAMHEWPLLIVVLVISLFVYGRLFGWLYTGYQETPATPGPSIKFAPQPGQMVYTITCFVQENSTTQRTTTVTNVSHDYLGTKGIDELLEWLRDHPKHRAKIEPYFDLRLWNLEQRKQPHTGAVHSFPRELLPHISGLLI